jgi:hypothetical protein
MGRAQKDGSNEYADRAPYRAKHEEQDEGTCQGDKTTREVERSRR